jgi:hypothetical protein
MGHHNVDGLDNGQTINIYMKTPENGGLCPHMVFDVHGSAAFDFEILEGATVTAATGTDVVAYNKNRNSSVVSSQIDNNSAPGGYTRDATVTADGTVIHHDTQSGGFFQGGRINFDREIILKTDTVYVFRLTSRGVGNRCHINLEWYEPAAS